MDTKGHIKRLEMTPLGLRVEYFDASEDTPKMPQERDTHFLRSAQQVAYKVLDLIPNSLHIYSRDDQKLVAEIIAQYAYDLVYFLLDNAPLHSGSFDTGYGTPDEIHETIEGLPDLTQWPELPTAEPS